MYYDPGRTGLQLVVSPAGSQWWQQRLTIKGKRCDLGLGSVQYVTLTEARAKAAENKRVARTGGDPRPSPVANPDAPLTFTQAAEAFLASKLEEFGSDKHKLQWRTSLEQFAFPIIGKTAVRDIGVGEILRVLEPHWLERTETASRLRGRIEAVLAWARVKGHATGDNPARWKGNLDAILPKPTKVAESGNWPALSLGDAAQWFRALQMREGMAARVLEFLTLTAARSGEVRGMTWEEVDLEARLWTIPAERMKAGREHRVPLTDEALAILKAQTPLNGSPYVFWATRGGMLSDMTISAVMRRMHESEVKAGRPGWIDPRSKKAAVPHGIRSTFRDWAAEHSEFPRDMAEIALAHRIGSDVERAYRRGDMLEKRRAMMREWGAFIRA
ncbi:phage integrase central domain-containing protein [Rubellimicrobium mesophilum]|uniref:phage integrase central domain-containing protein n=1 Tax=Rubellimicrobium mesophilum TaxID=1123067 RepID=UPI0005624BCB